MGGLDSRLSCVAAGMERLSSDLLQAVKNMVGVWECVGFVVAGW